MRAGAAVGPEIIPVGAVPIAFPTMRGGGREGGMPEGGDVHHLLKPLSVTRHGPNIHGTQRSHIPEGTAFQKLAHLLQPYSTTSFRNGSFQSGFSETQD